MGNYTVTVGYSHRREKIALSMDLKAFDVDEADEKGRQAIFAEMPAAKIHFVKVSDVKKP